MDKGLGHEETYMRMTNEQEEPPSPTQEVQVAPWVSPESHTESLAQERACQQALHRRIGHYIQADLLYDSLEVEADQFVKRSLTPTEAQDAHQQASGQIPSDDDDDAHSDLGYDPNWRTNLKKAGLFNEEDHSEEEHHNSEGKSQQRHSERQVLPIKGGYKYVTARGPAVVETPRTTCDGSYHLHPQDGQASPAVSLTSSHHVHAQHHHALQDRSPESDQPSPSVSSDKDKGSTSQRGIKVKSVRSHDYAGEHPSSSPELAEDLDEIHARYNQEFQTYYEQELGLTQGRERWRERKKQQKSISKLKSPKLLSNRKLGKLREDIVERNKVTLGRNTAKRGSYLKAHGLKLDTPDTVTEMCETEETPMAETLEGSSDPELRWLQRTQQRKVTQISKEKKARRKGNPDPSRQQQPPAPGIKPKRGDCLSPPTATPAAKTQTNPQKAPSLLPPPPTIHLNINLNTPTDLLPFLQGQDAIINLTPPHGLPHWNPSLLTGGGRDPQLSPHDGGLQGGVVSQPTSSPTRDPGYLQSKAWKPSQGSGEELNAGLQHWHLESNPGRKQRSTAPKWPLPREEEDQSQSIHSSQFSADSQGPPSTTQSQCSGSYVVLPPIGKPPTELSPGQTVKMANPMQRCSSDSYLAQMTRQKLLKERVTYKAYTLKDYKQLKQDVILQGLGPDYTACEMTKMRRQKLYSNVIREQNKKISRIPFLPTKDPEGSDKKVPRTKALEYAKSIAKPLIPSQPKPKVRQNHRSEGSTEHLEGLDLSQLTALELLRKRHEEEKQAVATFRKGCGSL